MVAIELVLEISLAPARVVSHRDMIPSVTKLLRKASEIVWQRDLLSPTPEIFLSNHMLPIKKDKNNLHC